MNHHRAPLARTRSETLHLLFVCTGNICRSPSAERLTAAWASAQGLTDLMTSSAGTRAVIGHPIHPEAQRVLLTLGGDPTDFAARQLTPKIAATADLVLTLTRAHRDAVLEQAPQKLNRTFTLAEAALLVTELGAREIVALANLRPHLSADAALDITDPIGQGPEVFDNVGANIAALLPPVLELCRPR